MKRNNGRIPQVVSCVCYYDSGGILLVFSLFILIVIHVEIFSLVFVLLLCCCLCTMRSRNGANGSDWLLMRMTTCRSYKSDLYLWKVNTPRADMNTEGEKRGE